jgi:predicted nucleotide-binding protein
MGYGITEGGFNASEIKLTPLGRRCVAPTEEGSDLLAIREAVLRPSVHGNFLRRLDQRRLPADTIAINILAELGVPPERRESTLKIIEENARSVGFLLENKGNLFVDLGEPVRAPNAVVNIPQREDALVDEDSDLTRASDDSQPPNPFTAKASNNRVFISHGANRDIVEQLKKILVYGKYEPVVAVERETTAKPISEKVFDAMRSCFAGVINVDAEGDWQAPDGSMHPKLNENVLIEIGAAMALYPDRYILLVEEGVKLPSNISGLYQCRYEGKDLGFDAAMKLLAAFNRFEGA